MHNAIEELTIKSSNYPHLIDDRYEKPDIEISIHKLKSKTIIIIYPGANGSKEGFDNKYVKMANMLTNKGIGAVLRTSNTYMLGNGWTTRLEIAIQYTLEHSLEICGCEIPQLYLIGHSAGAGAIDLVCSAYEQVKKVLFTSPAPIRRNNATQHGINDFTGEVYIRIPEHDVIPRFEAQLFYDLATKSSKRDLEIIKDCDHEWSGDTNLTNFIELPSKLLA